MEGKRCYGCMKLKKNSPVCEHCGYDERETNAPHQIPAGTVLKEQYLVGKALGQGGFGITYLGWDVYLDIPVAIKEYYPSGMVMRESSQSTTVACGAGEMGSRFQENRKRFLREAKALARFSNVPQIVQVNNYFLANNTAYIVMEYVEGITLKQHVKNHGGKLSAEETFGLLRPIIEALGKVHETGLVHRDISPDNIMLLPNGGVKLIDFGAVRDVQNADAEQPLTKSTEAILKQGFAPIEQYQKRGSLGPWTDVYALCATIYYCLTGQVPPDAPERVLGEIAVDWAGIPGLTQQQAAALEQGMELFPKKRTQSMKALWEALYPKPAEPLTVESGPEEQQTVAEETEMVSPPPPAPTPRKIPKAAIAAVAAVGIVLAAAAGWFLLRPSGREPVEPEPAVFSGQCGENLTWTLDPDTGAMTIDGSGPMADYGSEAAPWSEYQIKALTIGSGVTAIGDSAFENCAGLTAVTFGDGLTAIGSNAFRGTGVMELALPDSVTTLGECAFMDTPLTTVILGKGLESIGTKAFVNCPDLTLVDFNSNPILLEHWDDRIFTGGEDKLPPENLVIQCDYGTYAWAYAAHYGVVWEEEGTWETVASGDCGADLSWKLFEGGVFVFEGSGKMTDYNALWMEEGSSDWSKYRTLPPWVDYYDQIRLVYFSKDMTYLTQGAFYNCESLQYAYIPQGLELDWRTGFREAFRGSGLLQIEMPGLEGKSYTATRPDTFADCASLEFVSYGDGPGWGDRVNPGTFAGCTSLKKLVFGWHYLGMPEDWGNLLQGWWYENALVIPEDLTVYACPGGYYEQFCQENGIAFVPYINGRSMDGSGQWVDTVYRMDESGQCGDNVYWLLDREEKTLVLYAGVGSERPNNAVTWNYGGENYPDFYAFREEIEHVAISYFVTGLGDYLFRDLKNLKTVETGSYWPGTAETDYWPATGEEWIDYSSITSFGDGVFSGCSALESFVFPGSTRTFGTGIFENCYSLRSAAVHWEKLPANTFAGCASLECLQFGNNASFDENVFGTGSASDHPKKLIVYPWKMSNAEALAKKYGIPYETLTQAE